jgi:hypothetical protein
MMKLNSFILFGFVANVALVFSGRTVKYFSNLRTNLRPGVDGGAVSLEGMMSLVVYLGLKNTFLLQVKLWKLYGCPHEHSLSGRGVPIGSKLILEYLLLLYNRRVASFVSVDFYRLTKNNEHFQAKILLSSGTRLSQASIPSKDQTLRAPLSVSQQVFIDSFPNLKVWYCQHHLCRVLFIGILSIELLINL